MRPEAQTPPVHEYHRVYTYQVPIPRTVPTKPTHALPSRRANTDCAAPASPCPRAFFIPTVSASPPWIPVVSPSRIFRHAFSTSPSSPHPLRLRIPAVSASPPSPRPRRLRVPAVSASPPSPRPRRLRVPAVSASPSSPRPRRLRIPAASASPPPPRPRRLRIPAVSETTMSSSSATATASRSPSPATPESSDSAYAPFDPFDADQIAFLLQYRDFVFRKMFEKVSSLPEDRTDTIVQNVRELRKLDTSMFLSRTVAAEICMEARTNEAAYSALKKLNESGDLLFELSANVPGSSVVEELLKLFIKTRSITNNFTIPVLRALYSDFPSTDPTVRLVIILTVFVPTTPTTTPTMTAPAMRAKLESLGVAPLSRTNIVNVLLNPFIDRHRAIIDYAKVVIGMDPKKIHELVEEVAIKCLEVGCKGKLLRRLVDGYAHLKEVIAAVVVEKYQLGLEQLPDADDEEACARYRASLCREYCFLVGLDGTEPVQEGEGEDVVMDKVDGEDGEVEEESVDELDASPEGEVQRDVSELGSIGQDTLTNMIRQEESYNRGYRRRGYYRYGYSDMSAKLTYPADSLQVRKWVKEQFGLRSPVTTVFMIHAVMNDSLGAYLPYDDVQNHVPITLQHFKLLARLGRGTCWSMYRDIEKGAEFYFDASDYLNSQPMAKVKAEVKTEVAQLAIPPVASTLGYWRRRTSAKGGLGALIQNEDFSAWYRGLQSNQALPIDNWDDGAVVAKDEEHPMLEFDDLIDEHAYDNHANADAEHVGVRYSSRASILHVRVPLLCLYILGDIPAHDRVIISHLQHIQILSYLIPLPRGSKTTGEHPRLWQAEKSLQRLGAVMIAEINSRLDGMREKERYVSSAGRRTRAGRNWTM
ncbi:hypothetical protein HWV62_29867 [Athelia sp. TMB]|nr:hypothetical protein HWV62_29867 [Athelia sp. TMB]